MAAPTLSASRMTNEVERRNLRTSRSGWLVLMGKVVVTAACLLYLARHIDFANIVRAARSMDLGWAVLAAMALQLQLPLVALRWSKIVDALRPDGGHVGRLTMLGMSAIVTFFGQVMPNVASEGIRVWMLTRRGVALQAALMSVIIDRAIGVGSLMIVALATVLPVSGLAASAGIRGPFIEGLSVILAAGLAGLLLAPYLGVVLQRWRYTAWVGALLRGIHNVLLKNPASASIVGMSVVIQLIAIASIWLLGRSIGLPLTIGNSGVMFTVIFAMALLPISSAVGGCENLRWSRCSAQQVSRSSRRCFFQCRLDLSAWPAASRVPWCGIFYAPWRGDLRREHAQPASERPPTTNPVS